MKIGEYKVELNYGILKGFLDVMGLLMLYLIYQTTYTFIYQSVYPDMVLNNIFPGGVPAERWVPGLIFPAVAVGVTVYSIIFIFKKHREPKRYIVSAENAQKYYDTIMITNSLLRILALLAIWDYTYIHQANLLMGKVSWVSTQLILNLIVAGLILYITNERIKSFAEKCNDSEKITEIAESEEIADACKDVSGSALVTDKAEGDGENPDVTANSVKKTSVKLKAKNDDDIIMRS